MSGPLDLVVLLDHCAPRPVYHAIGNYRDQHPEGLTVACGAMWAPRNRWGFMDYGLSARLRREHARLFARPCKRCFG